MDKLMTLVFDIAVAMIISFAAVFIYFGLRSETVIRTMDKEIIENFLSDMKEKGSMTATDYENFMYKLSLTGNLYDVFLEHDFNILEPEYRMRSIEEIIAAQKAAYQGENIYHYKEVITQIPTVIDPIDNSGLTMNTETNESVLAGAINSPSIGHTHTDECYGGHKHISPYGTLDMTKVPVYVQVQRSPYVWNGTYTEGYSYRILFRCAICSQPLYAFSYFLSYPNITVLTERISYSTYQSNTVYNRVVISGSNYENVTSQTASFLSFAESMGATYANNYESRSFIYPFAGYPYWDLAGNMTYLPFTGCTYKQSDLQYERHVNPNACFPVGKKTKVKLHVYHSNDSSSGDSSIIMSVICTECNREIQGSSATLRGYSSSSTHSSAGSWWKEYLPDGRIVDVSRSGSMSTNFVGVYPNDDYVAFNNQNMEVYSAIQGIATKLGIGDSNNYTTGPIDYPLQGIPVRYGSYTTLPLVWEPYRGCPYCGNFGTAYSCGKASDISCDKIIQSIVPTHPVQSVYTNEALITTVKATYLDGSTKVLLASTSFSTANPVLNKPEILSLTDGLGTIKTCTITVNVIPRFKVCVNGHTYNLNTDGSDPGCIYCHTYVASIRIINPTTSTWTITIGTSLVDNGLKLLVTYFDGISEILTEGYEDNLDKQYLGTKMVTIGYKGATTQLLVTTVRAKMTCDICGFVYELYPDFTNPGCPKCISKTPVFTGNIFEYNSVNYTEAILNDLYEDGIYEFNKDDAIIIKVENKSSNLARNLLRSIYPNMTKRWLHIESAETIQSK